MRTSQRKVQRSAARSRPNETAGDSLLAEDRNERILRVAPDVREPSWEAAWPCPERGTGRPVTTVDLIDGTFELSKQLQGGRRCAEDDAPCSAVVRVVNGVLKLIERGSTHIGVVTDHGVKSFRHRLWPGYRGGKDCELGTTSQIHMLELVLASMGVMVWPMAELEAADGLASAARIAGEDCSVKLVRLWSPARKVAQCIRGCRVIQASKTGKGPMHEEWVRRKFGVLPSVVPDFLALAGDPADGFSGIAAVGAGKAARFLNDYGPIEYFPDWVLGEQRQQALLFKQLAALRSEEKLYADVEALRWRGPTDDFHDWADCLGAPNLLLRCLDAEGALRRPGLSKARRRGRPPRPRHVSW